MPYVSRVLVTSPYRNEIYGMVKKMLASSRTTIQKGDEKARENVHWNNDNYRPDKSTKLINELYQRLENKKSTQTRDKSFNSVTKRDRVAEVSGWGINASAKLAAEFSTEGTGSKENIERLLDMKAN